METDGTGYLCLSKQPLFLSLYTYELKSDDLEGGHPWDFGVSVSLSERFKTFYLYDTLGYAIFGRDSFWGIELKSNQFTGLFAVEWKAFSTASIIVQYLATQGLVDDLGSFSDPSTKSPWEPNGKLFEERCWNWA